MTENYSEEFFPPEIDERSEAMPGDPVIKYADRIMDRMRDVIPGGFPIRAFAPPELEHKVRIFRFDESADLERIEREIEALLSEGWQIANPGSCHNVTIMPFTRPKEITEDGKR